MLTSEEVAFLRARLDEDEAAAKTAQPGPWTYETEVGGFGPVGWVRVPLPMHEGAYTGLTRFTPLGTQDAETCAHIARHDPARVLADVAVWRRLLLEYSIPPGTDAVYGHTERETGFQFALSVALKAKIAVYSGHPDYPAARGDSQP
jgi:hypothetical protein